MAERHRAPAEPDPAERRPAPEDLSDPAGLLPKLVAPWNGWSALGTGGSPPSTGGVTGDSGP